MISGSLSEVLDHLSKNLQSYPRRVPGEMTLEGRLFQYADLHSFYYQCEQIFARRLYDFESAEAAPRILDCGAHIGLASMFFATRYPGARIDAFEADPAIAQMAARNVASFGFPNITVHSKAVWINSEGVSFAQSSDDSGFAGSGGVRVPSLRLRDLLLSEPVEMLKLDIEGGEFTVLRDADGALGQVRCLVAEAHQLRGEGSLGELLLLLERNGFQYVLADLNQAPWVPCGSKPPFHACQTDRYLVTVFAWKR